MSVIRRPDVLGRRAQRRVDGVTGALSAAIVEVLAVGIWFSLVIVETRTAFTALAGLGVLLFGALLRTGFFGAAVGNLSTLTPWRRFIVAAVFASSWLCWLLIAETIGGQTGLVTAAVALAGLLIVQFWLERRAVRLDTALSLPTSVSFPGLRTAIVPAFVLTIGATTMLWTVWFADWSLLSLVMPVGFRTLIVEVRTYVLALLVFGLCSFLAQKRRIEGMFDS